MKKENKPSELTLVITNVLEKIIKSDVVCPAVQQCKELLDRIKAEKLDIKLTSREY